MRIFSFLAAVAIIGFVLPFPTAAAVDDKAAERLQRDNDCTRCHTVAREKEGPPYRKIAEKYKGKPDAEQTLFLHMTSEPIVEVEGKKEKHKKIQAPNEASIRNLIQWILTR